MDRWRIDYGPHCGDLSRGLDEQNVGGALESASHQLGLRQVFIGVILVALLGNGAEHSTAVMVALKNKVGLAYGIAVWSSLRIALLVAPLLVFASY